MNVFMRSVVIAALIGLLGCVVFFAFGSISGRGEIGVASTFVFYLFGGVFLTKKYPASRWYGGAAINIPIWLFFKFWAEPGQYQIFFWSLVACIVSSYAGAVIGLWLSKRKIVFSKMIKVLLVTIPIFLIILATYILNTPQPISPQKNIFVGVWKSGSGFELQITSDGTAMITQNIEDRDSAYENLNIKVAPSHINSANVEFSGDSILTIVRYGYYARQYRIDKHPYIDGNQYKMVLNGVMLVRD